MNRRDFLKSITVGTVSVVVPAGIVDAEPSAGEGLKCNVNIPSYLKGFEGLYGEDPHGAALQWFKDAKFGLFIHYCLASLLPRGKEDFLEMTGGDEGRGTLESGFESEKTVAVKQQLFKRFSAKKFDADFIAELAVSARMRYITITTQHLGRLYMYRTKVTDFTSLNSPAKRDLVAELAKACEKRNLGLFLYVPGETPRTDEKYIEHNRTILRELLTQYGPIAGIWFDGIGDYHKNPQLYSKLSETYALVRSLQPQCLISFKDGAIGEEDFISPEHFLFPTPIKWDNELRQASWERKFERWKKKNGQERQKLFRNIPAEINTTMQECWNRDGVGARGGWINDVRARHLTADEVMELLAKARAQNANLLLNTGPLGDGSIHPDDIKALREVGRRIRRNGFPG